MTLQYDIDISYVMPPEAFTDSGSAELLKASGIVLNARGNYIAKFRDPKTAAALAGASENVKAYFDACGFAFIPSGKKLPSGVFDQQFDNQLDDVAKRLQENLRRFPLKDQMWNGFDLGECIVAVGNAQAVEVKVPVAKQPRTLRIQQPLWVNLLRPRVAFPVFALTLLLALQYVGVQQFTSTMAKAEDTRGSIIAK